MHYFLLAFLVLYPFCIFPAGSDPYYSAPKAIYLTVFVFLLWLSYLLLILKGTAKTTLTKVDWLLICLLLQITLSTYFSVNTELSLIGTKDRYEGLLAWIGYLSLFFFSSRYLDILKRNKVYFAVSVSSGLVGVYAILQHFLIDFLPRNSDKLTWTRSYGFFDNPNFYGTYTVIMLLFSLTAFLEEKKKPRLYLYAGTICILFVSMLYSLTRSAWLGSFVGFVILTLFVWKHKGLWLKWFLLSFALCCLFVIVNITEQSTTVQRANTIIADGNKVLTGDSHAGSSRLYIWKSSFPLLKDYYLFGSGPDTFGEVFPYDSPDELRQFFGTENIYVDKAHNEFLQMAVTMGLPALVIYCLLLGLLAIKLFRLVLSKTINFETQLYSIGLISVMFGYNVQAFFNISVITVAPFYWLFSGAAYNLVRKKNNQRYS
ncbi:O-antigen ligase family protein [Bacillus sp. Marseille-P3661]|uniref:O-antigen ligase family protein n=1 Tax=Bacillus sp. Marseille-P3661 TaxID=1936234 RepID=UPI000C829221|nr:O-antigen ligase family protein [Bacillus sp. Marseille-P3661]